MSIPRPISSAETEDTDVNAEIEEDAGFFTAGEIDRDFRFLELVVVVADAVMV
jgi:hypothetical protein